MADHWEEFVTGRPGVVLGVDGDGRPTMVGMVGSEEPGPWPHESCLDCGLRMPSDDHADTHYSMTGHMMGWSLDDPRAASWPVATDDQVMGRA